MAAIRLPNSWDPRPYQLPAWLAFEGGKRRGAMIWHRRAGKDSFGLNFTATQAMQRVGVYWHLAPTQKQVRKIVWDNINANGHRVIDQVWPSALRRSVNSQEMKIELVNGSIWQCVGSDNYDSLVGANPVGVVFSEYSLADPAAWEYVRPILAENGGWAIFLFTPRGKNHAYALYRMAQRNPDWFCEVLTADDTRAISAEAIEAEREAGMSEEMVAQEFYCSFEAPNAGAYYGKQMAQAWQDNRVGRVPVEPGVPCETWWDLGVDDSTAIWITQTVVREIRCVHYYENSGEGLAHYANYLAEWAARHETRFLRHGMPHDIEVRELATGKSRREVCERQLGLRPIVVAPRLDLESGIEQVRRILSQCWFDEEGCARGVAALTEYSKDWDETRKVFAARPKHDWASHGADAFRTLATIHPGRAESSVEGRSDRYSRARRPRGGWMSW
jgi:phage terminase large subunit